MKTEYLHVHPVCHTPPPSPTAPPSFQALKTFRMYVHCARFIFRLSRIRQIPELLPMEKAQQDPYRLMPIRKTVDAWTFTLYSHWVKKGEGMGQNRAALFQHNPRVVERTSSLETNKSHLYVSKGSRQIFTQ